MKNNLVSVCITTYNRKKIFPLTLNSVINQTYKDIEIIVVDDCSNDGTQDLIENEILKIDHRIKYIRHNKNKGLAAARNTAIFSANGKYFTFCDDDDLWEKNFIKEFKNEASKYDHNWLFCCGFKYKDLLGKNIEFTLNFESDLRSFVKDGYTPPVASQFYNLSSLRSIKGYNEKIKSGVDHDLWIRLAKIKDIKIKYIPKILSMPNSNVIQTRMTTNFYQRINGIKESLNIWKNDLIIVYGDRFYFNFCNAYLLREYSKFFKIFLKELNIKMIIKILKAGPSFIILKMLFNLFIKFVSKSTFFIFKKKITLNIKPELKILNK